MHFYKMCFDTYKNALIINLVMENKSGFKTTTNKEC